MMAHDCRCGVCGAEYPYVQDPLDDVGKFNRAHGARTLASAIMKIAPDLAEAIAKRWEEIQGSEKTALDEFLAVLRKPLTVTSSQEKT